MKTIDLTQQPIQLLAFFALAHHEPMVVSAPDGREYVVAEADDCEQEVATLRASAAFQRFLDARLATRQQRRSITDVLVEIDQAIAHEQTPYASNTY